MGIIKKAVRKQQRKAKAAVRAKAVSTVKKATPGLCPKTSSGRHEYKSVKVGGQLTHPTCKCGRVS